MYIKFKKKSNHRILTGLPPPFLGYRGVSRGVSRGIYFVCSYALKRHPRRFFYLYIHKHNSHIYLVILSTCLEFL